MKVEDNISIMKSSIEIIEMYVGGIQEYIEKEHNRKFSVNLIDMIKNELFHLFSIMVIARGNDENIWELNDDQLYVCEELLGIMDADARVRRIGKHIVYFSDGVQIDYSKSFCWDSLEILEDYIWLQYVNCDWQGRYPDDSKYGNLAGQKYNYTQHVIENILLDRYRLLLMGFVDIESDKSTDEYLNMLNTYNELNNYLWKEIESILHKNLQKFAENGFYIREFMSLASFICKEHILEKHNVDKLHQYIEELRQMGY